MSHVEDECKMLDPPSQFPFPFTPYPIQEGFMQALYSALEGQKLGIFESPTGTGKSLSLICGSLTWLRDHEKREREELSSKLKSLKEETSESDLKNDPVDWFAQQTTQVEARQKQFQLKIEKDKIDKYDDKIAKMREAHKKRKQNRDQENERDKLLAIQIKKQVIESSKICKKIAEDDDEDIVLEDVSDLNQLEEESDEEDPNDESYQGTKIFFCSRTHSQLAQFIGEVQRSVFAEDIRLVPLASRQNYCVNEAVTKLKSMTLINERCLDMQKKGTKTTKKDDDGVSAKKLKTSSKGCPFMAPYGSHLLKESMLCEVQDVEQLVNAGRSLGACPYYASRSAVENAQVVVVPYNTLLHKATRKASGLKLSGSVIIIDEAHNLLEAIGHIHSCVISGQQLSHAYSQLVQYRDRYESRFSPMNLLLLNRLIFVVGKLLRVIGGKPGVNSTELKQDLESKVLTLQDFLLTAEIDNINVYGLLEFCQKSKLAHKLHGFAEKYQPCVILQKPDPVARQQNPIGGVRAFLKEMENKDKSQIAKATPLATVSSKPAITAEANQGNNPLLGVLAFLETLTNDCEDGRILIQKHKLASTSSLKFLLLNPASHFRDIVREARAVIVAGGTMQPLSEFQDQLFKAAGGDPTRIINFSCGHVVPPENILALAIGCGPSGKVFDFSYSGRNAPEVLMDLSRLMENVCKVVPGGVVCFFPSYEYEQIVAQHLQSNSAWDRIESTKKIFREPKSSSQVDEVLSQYAKCIREAKHGSCKTGALLLSVIGGKLSEGLNFSDDLGRCVMVVGLPYPNIKSAELQEKMKFLDNSVGPGHGREHLENLCMKAVNQSIGRAVRHKDDYASVLLLDRRYLLPTRRNSLPQWIRSSLYTHEKFGPAFGMIAKFFQARKQRAAE